MKDMGYRDIGYRVVRECIGAEDPEWIYYVIKRVFAKEDGTLVEAQPSTHELIRKRVDILRTALVGMLEGVDKPVLVLKDGKLVEVADEPSRQPR
jgi:hypothetical protein